MMTNEQLAELIFKDVTTTLDDLERRYPKRTLKQGAEVTRFAPSPTGFLHTGSLFTALICKKVASQTGGIFYLRLEDTDTKREIQGSKFELLNQLSIFGVTPSEGFLGDREVGEYGPYVQSKRADIYKVAIKHLISIGKAYPCFCSQEELNEIRANQEAHKIMPGYYGQFAKYRFLNNDERAKLIQEGKPFVIRFKSSGSHLHKIKVKDLIRGEFEIAQNDQDIVIYKSDGLPTYHFAHVVDDHFMRTTTVIRGEEWIASLPIHVELFDALGWEAPNYAHLPVIMKLDENNHKRKLSKRLDKEAAVSYFLEDGYPPKSLIMYLMTIANSNFEEWIFAKHFKDMDEFEFSFSKVSLEGALFDIGKLNFFSKEILALLSKEQITDMIKDYASKYDDKLLSLINRDPNYFMNIMNIEREKENPRKDYYRFKDIYDSILFFYDDKYEEITNNNPLQFNPKFDKVVIIDILKDLKDNLPYDNVDESTWFIALKDTAFKHSFAPNNKTYKQDMDKYLGVVADVAEMLRISITTRKQSPNLFYCLQVIGKERIDKRIDYVINYLQK